MRHSKPYKFRAARRRKGNLNKAQAIINWYTKNKCDVEEMIHDTPHAQPLCTGDATELFLAETNSMIPGEACRYLQVQDMEDSSTFGLEDEDNSRISGDEFELLDSADTNSFEQFVKDEDACSDIFSDCENPDEIDSENTSRTV